MKCLICSELIVIKRNFVNLFDETYQVLCNKCQSELIYSYYYEVIPINSGIIHHYYIKPNTDLVELRSDQFLLGPIYQRARRLQLPVIYFDKLDEEKFNILDNLLWGDLFIITIS